MSVMGHKQVSTPAPFNIADMRSPPKIRCKKVTPTTWSRTAFAFGKAERMPEPGTGGLIEEPFDPSKLAKVPTSLGHPLKGKSPWAKPKNVLKYMLPTSADTPSPQSYLPRNPSAAEPRPANTISLLRQSSAKLVNHRNQSATNLDGRAVSTFGGPTRSLYQLGVPRDGLFLPGPGEYHSSGTTTGFAGLSSIGQRVHSSVLQACGRDGNKICTLQKNGLVGISQVVHKSPDQVRAESRFNYERMDRSSSAMAVQRPSSKQSRPSSVATSTMPLDIQSGDWATIEVTEPEDEGVDFGDTAAGNRSSMFFAYSSSKGEITQQSQRRSSTPSPSAEQRGIYDLDAVHRALGKTHNIQLRKQLERRRELMLTPLQKRRTKHKVPRPGIDETETGCGSEPSALESHRADESNVEEPSVLSNTQECGGIDNALTPVDPSVTKDVANESEHLSPTDADGALSVGFVDRPGSGVSQGRSSRRTSAAMSRKSSRPQSSAARSQSSGGSA